jgi:hypothetical protein
VGQSLLLTALQSHITQLLSMARELLAPSVCTLGQQSSSSSSSNVGGGSSSSNSSASASELNPQQEQQQRRAWELCLAQVQHDLLLVLQLTKHWRHHNAHLCLPQAIKQKW